MRIKPIQSMSYTHGDGWHYHVNSTSYFTLSDALSGMKIPATLRGRVLEFQIKLHSASIHLANDYGVEWKKAEPLQNIARSIRYELETIDSSFGPLLDSIAKMGLARA